MKKIVFALFIGLGIGFASLAFAFDQPFNNGYVGMDFATYQQSGFDNIAFFAGSHPGRITYVFYQGSLNFVDYVGIPNGAFNSSDSSQVIFGEIMEDGLIHNRPQWSNTGVPIGGWIDPNWYSDTVYTSNTINDSNPDFRVFPNVNFSQIVVNNFTAPTCEQLGNCPPPPSIYADIFSGVIATVSALILIMLPIAIYLFSILLAFKFGRKVFDWYASPSAWEKEKKGYDDLMKETDSLLKGLK